MDPLNPGSATPDASQLNAADPKPNDGTPAPVVPQGMEALSLAELNQLTGRDFKSKDSALKSIQDTYKFVTTRTSDLESRVKAEVADNYKKLAEDFAAQQKEMFYLQHPEYASHRKLIDNLGKNPSEVVNGDIFKETYGKLAEHEKTVKLKTVLESNPRVAASRDSISKAADLKNNQHGIVTEEVERLATQAVIDAYGLNS